MEDPPATTESDYVQEALRESEERYRQMFEKNRAVKLLIDPESGAIVDANPAAAHFYGYSVEQLKKMNISHINILSIEQIKLEMTRAATEDRFHFFFHHRLASGEIRDVEVYSSPLSLHGRKLLFSIIHDITERNRAEEARRDLLRRLVAAQEEECRRISHELHDQMGQHLVALKLALRSIEESLQSGLLDFRLIKQAQGIADRIDRDVDRLVLGLSPPSLEDLGLCAVLSQYVKELSEPGNIKIDFHSSGFDERRLPLNIEIALYRVVQEALTNALKHAKATHVSVILERRSAKVLAVIEDNGCGFDIDSVRRNSGRKRSLGLLGMEERVNLIGGRLNIESTLGEGATVFVHIEISSNREEDGAQ